MQLLLESKSPHLESSFKKKQGKNAMHTEDYKAEIRTVSAADCKLFVSVNKFISSVTQEVALQQEFLSFCFLSP